MASDFANDITLLNGFQQGDLLAEKRVFQQFFRPLCLFSERITGQLEASEDIVADSFGKAWGRRGEYPTMDNLKAFLYRAVRNASINYIEAQRRHQSHHEQILYITKDDKTSEEAMEREILRVELLQEIYNEIDSLPEKCRQIFKLLFIYEQTTEQVARQLSINMQTVRSQKARAIQLIKTELLRKNRVQTFLLLTVLLGKI